MSAVLRQLAEHLQVHPAERARTGPVAGHDGVEWQVRGRRPSQGTRVPVDSLFTNLESGLSLDEYLDCFPDVTREQAVAVLEYAQKLTLQPAA